MGLSDFQLRYYNTALRKERDEEERSMRIIKEPEVYLVGRR